MFKEDYSTPIFPKVEEKVDPVVETLLKAAQHVWNGWCQGAMFGHEGAVCAYGALALAADIGCPAFGPPPREVAYHPAARELARYIARHHAEFAALSARIRIVEFNDDASRTAAEVVAAFEGAADSRARALAGRK